MSARPETATTVRISPTPTRAFSRSKGADHENDAGTRRTRGGRRNDLPRGGPETVTDALADGTEGVGVEGQGPEDRRP